MEAETSKGLGLMVLPVPLCYLSAEIGYSLSSPLSLCGSWNRSKALEFAALGGSAPSNFPKVCRPTAEFFGIEQVYNLAETSKRLAKQDTALPP